MKYNWVTNIKPGDDGADIYWRALWAMEEDAICSMLSERALQGLANAYHDGMVNENNKARFTNTGARYFAREVIRHSPLSILRPEAIEHIGSVIEKAMFPVDEGK